MNSKYLKSVINYANARYLGVDLVNLYKESGEKIAADLAGKFGKDKSFAIICGTGGNGGDGFSIAMNLVLNQHDNVCLYLIGRSVSITDPAVKTLWKEVIEFSKDHKELIIKQDSYSKDIEQSDVVIECLSGTGFEGDKLNKRFSDVVKRISHFDSRLVAIDVPVPSYTPDIVYSLMYPKTENAITIEMELPKELGLYCGPGDAKYLFEPKLFSHKKKNGKLLYISNTSNTEDIQTAAQIAEQYNVQLSVYNPFNSVNYKNVEPIDHKDLDLAIAATDSIIFGEFDDVSLLNRGLINEIIEYKGRKYIFGSNALNFFDLDKLKSFPDAVVLLTKNEILELKGQHISDKRLAVEFGVDVASIGMQTALYNKEGEFKINVSPLSAKSYYKSLLSSLVAVLSTKNDFWLSIKAAVFLLDLSAKLVNGDSEELDQNNIIARIVKSLEWCRSF